MNTLQQNEEWFQARRGKFTGSNFKYIINKGRGKDFTEQGYTYIRKVVAERMGSYEFQTTNNACKWGNEQESFAVLEYEEATGYVVEETGFQLHSSYDFVGCSVDGLVLNEGGIIEVKSPYAPANFIRYATDLSYIEKEHKAQIQGNMWVMESDFCDFIAFDPRNEIKIFIHRFGRDEEYIKKLEDRVVLANQIAEEMYNDIIHPNVEF